MSKSKNRRASRQNLRKEQSQTDKETSLWEMGSKLANPLASYRSFLDEVRAKSLNSTDYMLDVSSHLIDLTASLITSLILGTGLTLNLRENSNAELSPVTKAAISLPADQEEHEEGLRFIKRLMRRAKMSVSSFLVALFYIHRFHDEHPRQKILVDRFGNSVIPTFLVSLLSADKMVFDATYTTKDWAEFSDHRYTVDELNEMERTFLQRMNYRLWITREQFDEFISYLDFTLLFRQMLQRWSSLSYRDLAALTHGIPHMFNMSSHVDVTLMEALALLVKIVLGIVSTYLTALFASTVLFRVIAYNSSSWQSSSLYSTPITTPTEILLQI